MNFCTHIHFILLYLHIFLIFLKQKKLNFEFFKKERASWSPSSKRHFHRIRAFLGLRYQIVMRKKPEGLNVQFSELKLYGCKKKEGNAAQICPGAELYV